MARDHRPYNEKAHKELAEPAEDLVAWHLRYKGLRVQRHPDGPMGIDIKVRHGHVECYVEVEVKSGWPGDQFPHDTITWMASKIRDYSGGYHGCETFYYLVNIPMTRICWAPFDELKHLGWPSRIPNCENLDLVETKRSVGRFEEIIK